MAARKPDPKLLLDTEISFFCASDCELLACQADELDWFWPEAAFAGAATAANSIMTHARMLLAKRRTNPVERRVPMSRSPPNAHELR